MKIQTVVESGQVIDAFAVSAKQVPYVAAITLTKLSEDGRLALQKKMPVSFDRPTDYTLRGVYTRSASKSKLEAEVYVPDSTDAQGRSKREYIRPGAAGSPGRRQKRTEFLLTKTGALPTGWVTTPGKGAVLDAYGNISGSVYKQIINVLQIRRDTKPVSGRSQKAAARLKVDALFFVVKPGPNKQAKNGGWLPPGVWRNLPGGKITQILKFVKKATYKPRLDLKQVATEAVNDNLARRWRESSLIIAERFARKG